VDDSTVSGNSLGRSSRRFKLVASFRPIGAERELESERTRASQQEGGWSRREKIHGHAGSRRQGAAATGMKRGAYPWPAATAAAVRVLQAARTRPGGPDRTTGTIPAAEAGTAPRRSGAAPEAQPGARRRCR